MEYRFEGEKSQTIQKERIKKAILLRQKDDPHLRRKGGHRFRENKDSNLGAITNVSMHVKEVHLQRKMN